MLERYLQSQNTLRPLTDEGNLAKYYDIYDIGLGDLEAIELTLANRSLEDRYSLRSLRDLFGKLYTARKSVLCCLLALSADGSASDIARWGSAVEEMRELAGVTGASMTKMTNILDEEDRELLRYVYCGKALANFDFRRGCYSSFSAAHRFSKQGEYACTISTTQLALPGRAFLACKDARRQ